MFQFLFFLFILFLFLLNSTNLFFPEGDFPKEEAPLMDESAKEILSVGKSDKLIMMIHGFASSPASFVDYCQRFLDMNYDVIVPRLPGCGTSPQDFIRSRYSHWYKHVKSIYEHYRPQYKVVHLIGLSLGGSLTLNLAEDFCRSDLSPTSLVIAGTPVFLNRFPRVIKDPRLYFSGLLRLFVSFIPSNEEKKHSSLPDNASAWKGYYGIFPIQIHSFKIALKKIHRDLSKIDVPVYLSHAKKDRTVPFENLLEILLKISSKNIQTRIFDLGEFRHTRHLLFLYDSTRHRIFQDLLFFFKEVEKTHETLHKKSL